MPHNDLRSGDHVRPRPVLLCLLLLAAAGCRDGGATGAISRERFVAANVALRTLPADASEEQRAAVLARYRVTAEELRGWVEANAHRPEVLADAWQQVAARLDSLAMERPQPEGAEGVIDAPPPPPGGEPVPDFVKDTISPWDDPHELDAPARRMRERLRGPPPPLPDEARVEIQ